MNHKPHDRLAVDIGSTFATGFTASAYDKVKRGFGIDGDAIKISDPVQMLADLEVPVIKAIGSDTIGFCTDSGFRHGWREWTTRRNLRVWMSKNIRLKGRNDGGWDQYVNGERVNTMVAGGIYFDPVEYPQWRTFGPELFTDGILRHVEERARYLHDSTDLAVFYNSPFAVSNSTSVDYLCALLAEKEEAHERIEKWASSIVESLKLVLDAVKGYIDVIGFSGDAGTQKASLFNPEVYREMIVPHMKQVTDYVHKNSEIKCFLHSCGSVYELIDCFIDMGMDALNPLQLSAADMEPEKLVEEFGGRIVFWGGGCDTQHVLPYGSPAQVKAEVNNRLSVYTRVPGYIFSQVHNIQPDVPLENIMAMIGELKRWKEKTHR